MVARRTLFTQASANAMLPLVRSIVAGALDDLAELQRAEVERRDLAVKSEAGATTAKQAVGLELLGDDLEARAHEELEELGLDPVDLVVGHVDFPTRREGKPVVLCWRNGDAQVGHWHGVSEGVLERRLIP